MEEIVLICRNPWCKAQYVFRKPSDLEEKEIVYPRQCPKCQSFDKELSGGIEWKDKKYEGSRYDNRPHEINYKVTNFK